MTQAGSQGIRLIVRTLFVAIVFVANLFTINLIKSGDLIGTDISQQKGISFCGIALSEGTQTSNTDNSLYLLNQRPDGLIFKAHAHDKIKETSGSSSRPQFMPVCQNLPEVNLKSSSFIQKIAIVPDSVLADQLFKPS